MQGQVRADVTDVRPVPCTFTRVDPMAESVQEKLSRVRKPRVHIKYEVETEGAAVLKELPFVVGVVGDFSGEPAEPQKPLRERKFVQIDRDNFNDVMAKLTPGVSVRVPNTLSPDGGEF